MKNILVKGLFVGVCMLAVHIAANAQESTNHSSGGSVAGILAKTTVKVPVIIVGSAAKAGWEVTKFGTKHVAAPIAKALFVRAAPKAGIYMLKNTALGIKYGLPLALKLSIL